MGTAEIVATGLAFPEGPAWCPDGSVILTAVAGGTVHRVWPATGAVELMADTAGGPNAAVPASDGGALVTQNGGFDFGGRVESFPPCRPVRPGLVRIRPGGEVSWVADAGLLAPNDLVVAADGTVFFTDPGPAPPEPGRTVGRVMAWTEAGGLRRVAGGFGFCNGIAFDPAGDLVVVEEKGLLRLAPDGDHEWIVEELGPGGGDGFCVDADGRFYVAAGRDHGVRVIDPDGAELDFLLLDGPGFTTNCCFGGRDRRTLFVTDGLPGHLVAFEAMPTPGLAVHVWPVRNRDDQPEP